MSYTIYGTHLRPGHCEVHPDERHQYGSFSCIESFDIEREQPYPEPTTEDLCSPHPYHGDDNSGGRCYCGTQRYPAGGPAVAQSAAQEERRGD